MTDQSQQISALTQAITELTKRIETLEGKERVAAYDPATNSVAEAAIDTLSIRSCKVMPKPAEEDSKIQIEHTARLAANGFTESLIEIEKHLKRPGGLAEQFEAAQREAEERESAIGMELMQIKSDLASRSTFGDLASLQNALSNRSS